MQDQPQARPAVVGSERRVVLFVAVTAIAWLSDCWCYQIEAHRLDDGTRVFTVSADDGQFHIETDLRRACTWCEQHASAKSAEAAGQAA
jgi:hypothetical protein